MRDIIPHLTLAAVLLSAARLCLSQEPQRIGVDEHLGQQIPLDSFTFADEDGKPVTLTQLVDRPTIITLVYYRCPGICTPLLQELAFAMDKSDLEPGPDYRVITISFDPTETAELARPKKENMIAEVKSRTVPQDAWRFLTGDEDNIKRITDAIGFRYTRDENGIDYVHTAVLTFLSPEGKIVRYLNGTQFNPVDLKMAIVDASQGRARSFMRRIERLCYSYDPEGRAYVFQINRLILGVTLLFALLFGGFLLWRGVRKRPAHQTVSRSIS